MKVVLNTCWAGPNGCFRPGDTADVSDEQGTDLVKHRYATEVPLEPIKVVAKDVEPEADAPQPRKVKRGGTRSNNAAGS